MTGNTGGNTGGLGTTLGISNVNPDLLLNEHDPLISPDDSGPGTDKAAVHDMTKRPIAAGGLQPKSAKYAAGWLTKPKSQAVRQLGILHQK
jgi:hypothetical protein